MPADPGGGTLDPDYAAALGQALFAFAALEDAAIRICERLDPASMAELSDRTAGRVADTLLHLLGEQEQPNPDLKQAATDFRFLVGTRNALVHGKPGLGQAGKLALFRYDDEWTLGELAAVAAAFADCRAQLLQ